MVPRIVVPDEEDRATVVAALIQYSHGVVHAASGFGDIGRFIHEQRIIVELMEELVEQAREDAVRDTFGPLPSDQDIAEAVEEFRGKFFGNDDTA
jgi:hypothetical protein